MKQSFWFIVHAIAFVIVVLIVGVLALWDAGPEIWRELRKNHSRTISLRRST